MKTFTKICLAIAGIFVVLGIIGVAAGMAMGAQPKQFLNLAHYPGSVLHWDDWTDRAVDDWEEEFEDKWENEWEDELDDIGERLDEDLDYLDEEWENHHLDLEREHATDWNVDEFEGVYGNADTQKLELDFNKCVVKIYTHEGDDILIKGSNAKGYFETRSHGDTLLLKDHRGSSRKALHLEIYLPERSFKSIELDLGAAKLYAETLCADEVELSLGAGEAAIGSIEAEETDLEVGTGSCTVDSMASRKKADLEVGAGELTVSSYDGGSLDLECGIGTLAVDARGQEGDYNYEISCGIGSVQVGLSSYSGLGREKTINNGASKKISIECGIGDVELNFQD